MANIERLFGYAMRYDENGEIVGILMGFLTRASAIQHVHDMGLTVTPDDSMENADVYLEEVEIHEAVL